MLQIKADSRYADVMERALYNGVLSGMALASSNLAVLMAHPFVLMLKPAVAMSAQPDMTVSAVSLIETVLFLAIALWLAKSKRYE